jgi:hypothetical protein
VVRCWLARTQLSQAAVSLQLKGRLPSTALLLSTSRGSCRLSEPSRNYNALDPQRQLAENTSGFGEGCGTWKGGATLSCLRVMQDDLAVVRKAQVDDPGAEGLAGNSYSCPELETVGAEPEVADGQCPRAAGLWLVNDRRGR